MTRDLKILTFVLLLSACHGSPPEGVYPCRTAADCPSVWVCRDDGLCWIHPLPPDAGADSGRNCVPEQCNGRDDDCDALVDEAVLTVGAAVSADPVQPPPVYFGGLISPLTDGFVVFGTSNNMATSGGWSTLDANGTMRVVAPATFPTFFLDTARSGDQVVTSGQTTIDATGLGIATFDFATTTAAQSFLALGNTSDDVRLSFVADFDGMIAHVYQLLPDASGATFVRRAHIDTTVPSVVSGTDVLITTDVESGLSLVHTSANNFLAYRTVSGHDLELFRDDYRPGGLTQIGVVASTSERLTQSRLAIRDPQRPVSATNPILFVWATSSGVVSFVEINDVTDATSFAASPVRSLSGTRGPASSLIPLPGIAIVPAPFLASSDPPHWLVAILGNDGGVPLSVAQVYEITQMSIREVVVPDEMYTERDELGMAVSGTHIRFAEAGNAGGIVTRSIGCE